jgi:hypothetical protein
MRGKIVCFITIDWPRIWRASPTFQTYMNGQVVMKPAASTTAASHISPQAGSSANISAGAASSLINNITFV